MNAKDEVIDWLRDAYAMERGLEFTLKKISESDSHQSDVREAARRHLEETRRHASTVQSLLRGLNADTSTLKTGIGMMAELAKGITTRLAHDEPIKDLLASYATEHFEIGCYKALAAAAETAGLPHVAQACAGIIPEEEAMAETIYDSLPVVVQNYFVTQKFSKAA